MRVASEITGMAEAVRTDKDGIIFGLVFFGNLDSILLWLFLLSIVVESGTAVDAIVVAIPSGVVAVAAEEDEGILFSLVALFSFSSLVVTVDMSSDGTVVVRCGRGNESRLWGSALCGNDNC